MFVCGWLRYPSRLQAQGFTYRQVKIRTGACGGDSRWSKVPNIFTIIRCRYILMLYCTLSLFVRDLICTRVSILETPSIAPRTLASQPKLTICIKRKDPDRKNDTLIHRRKLGKILDQRAR